MTPAGVLRVAWSHKGWIVGSVALAAGLGALAGSVLHERTRCRATLLMEVTPHTEADALFACKSADVLARAVEACDLAAPLSPARLAAETTVELVGQNRLSVTVERSDRLEAEMLVATIAREAARAVRVLADRASDEDLAAIEQADKEKRQVEANHKEFQRQLSQLMTEYPFEIGAHGEVVTASRRQLAEAQQALAKARRELVDVDAAVAALAAKLATPVAALTAESERLEPPAARQIRQRMGAVDAEIVRLRAEFTDMHPRVMKAIAERDRLASELAAAAPATVSASDRSLETQVRAQLTDREGERARVASRVAQLEAEEKRLADHVKTGAATTEDRARKLAVSLKASAKSLETAQQRSEVARRAAEERRISYPAITVRTDAPPTQVIRHGATAGLLGAVGAAVGFVIGLLLAAFVEALNPIIRYPEDIRRHIELPVLATVPAVALADIRRGGRTRAGMLGSVAWLLVFFAVAAALLGLVYPGWNRIRALFPERAGPAARPAVEARE
jgi:septal ring factor EnvC (AmiA/AmiB activator)